MSDVSGAYVFPRVLSIYTEVVNRNRQNQDNIAIRYRGNEITYSEMFETVDIFCRALHSLGIKRGSEVPVCMIVSPEFIYLFLALSRIGAKINLFGEWFEPKYLQNILKASESEIAFITDNHFERLERVLADSGIKKVVHFSLSDSLKGGINPFAKEDCKYLEFDKSVTNHYGAVLIDTKKWFEIGMKSVGIFSEEGITLDDEFCITYTSGTTDPQRPKAVLHCVRSHMVVSRFKDKDMFGGRRFEKCHGAGAFPDLCPCGDCYGNYRPAVSRKHDCSRANI